MQNFLKLGHSLPVLPVALALARLKPWREDSDTRDCRQGPAGDVESVLLRFPPRSGVEMMADLENYMAGTPSFDWHESVDYPVYDLLPEIRPLVEMTMAFVKGERLGRVILNKIRPGGRVSPHEDTPTVSDYYNRFHIVIQSQPGVVFKADDEQVFMATGDFWFFNNKSLHEVINNSADDRIHLIMDIRCRQGVQS